MSIQCPNCQESDRKLYFSFCFLIYYRYIAGEDDRWRSVVKIECAGNEGTAVCVHSSDRLLLLTCAHVVKHVCKRCAVVCLTVLSRKSRYVLTGNTVGGDGAPQRPGHQGHHSGRHTPRCSIRCSRDRLRTIHRRDWALSNIGPSCCCRWADERCEHGQFFIINNISVLRGFHRSKSDCSGIRSWCIRRLGR